MRLLFFLSISTILIVSCGKTSPRKISELVAATDSVIANFVDSDPNQYRYLTLDTFVWGADTASIAVVYDGDVPLRIAYFSETAPDNEWHFFLDRESGKTLYFLETGLNLAEGHRFQNQFYYHNGKLLKGETAVVECTHDEHDHELQWVEYQSHNKNNDFRLIGDAVDALVKEIIIAVEADQPNLSPAANAARKRGAAHWGTGDNGAWSITVIPDKQIDFEYTDNGKKLLTFTDFEQLPVDGGEKIVYEANLDNKQLAVEFMLADCNVNDGFKKPFSVVINYDGKKYTGCGVFF